MKSEIIEVAPVPEKSKYPYIGHDKSTGRTILFTEPFSGTVLHEKSFTWGVGYTSKSWSESSFTPFAGTIKLSND